MYAYLHGFASGPTSSKGKWLRERFAETGLELLLPDLTPGPGGFERATPLTMLREVEGMLAKAAEGESSVLVGSSLGGLLATLAASRSPERIEKIILLAPAFRLAERWRARMDPAELARFREAGSMLVDHYATGTRRTMPYGFLEDADTLPPFPRVSLPVLTIAGKYDELVPLADVEQFAALTPSAKLVVMDDGHDLAASLPKIWDEIRSFLAI